MTLQLSSFARAVITASASSAAGNDYRNIRLEDARLFACNRRNRSAEICFMIERNRSDDAQMRLNDVRCIETAAQSNFNHGHICLTLECKKRHSRHGFEVRRVRVEFSSLDHCLSRAVNRREEFSKTALRDFSSVEADPLGGTDQVRRSIQSGAQPLGSHCRIDHGAGRPFAICSGNMHEGLVVLRIVQRWREGP